jgi:glyoxylase-like metal-dependent hydrolase (beta-lactamase superfamily II)
MKITPIVASTFLSDGGVMFGLVPRPIWSRLCPPDKQNRIRQNANALLVELDDGRTGLIDTGCGPADAYSEKVLQINGLGPGWPLIDAVAQHGHTPDDIDFVILSHLHWDHAAGATNSDGSPTFPNAELVVFEQEWDDAHSGNPLFYKAYPNEAIEPLSNYTKIRKADAEELYPGVSFIHTGGHTPGHCAVLLEADTLHINHPDVVEQGYSRALFMADICPTSHHLRMVFHPAYDLLPLETRAWKQKWLPQCARDNTLLFFCHDPDVAAACIQPDERAEFSLRSDETYRTVAPQERS